MSKSGEGNFRRPDFGGRGEGGEKIFELCKISTCEPRNNTLKINPSVAPRRVVRHYSLKFSVLSRVASNVKSGEIGFELKDRYRRTGDRQTLTGKGRGAVGVEIHVKRAARGTGPPRGVLVDKKRTDDITEKTQKPKKCNPVNWR